MWDGWHSRNAVFWDWDHLLPSISRLDYGELSVGWWCKHRWSEFWCCRHSRCRRHHRRLLCWWKQQNNAANDNRLSFDSALNNLATIPRRSSLLSNASSARCSLRPISTTSTDSRRSCASSGASPVGQDEEGLARGGAGSEMPVASVATEYKEKDRVDKRISRERANIHWKARNVTRLLLFSLTRCGDRMLRRREVVGKVVMRGLVVDVWVGTRT